MINRENTPRAWRRWDSAPPRHHVAVIVRCKGRRILAADLGDPAPLTFAHRGEWATYELRGQRFAPDRAAGNPGGRVASSRLVECPNHHEGHVIDGVKLREVLDVMTRHAEPAAVEVGRIV